MNQNVCFVIYDRARNNRGLRGKSLLLWPWALFFYVQGAGGAPFFSGVLCFQSILQLFGFGSSPATPGPLLRTGGGRLGALLPG